MFTDKEKVWFDNLNEAKDKLEKYRGLSEYKSDIKFIESYVKFISLALTYDNLKSLIDTNKPLKRLIRVYKTIKPYELEETHLENVLLDGLFVVTDVMFIDYSIYNEYANNPVSSVLENLSVPDTLICDTLKSVFIDNIQYGVGLIDTPFNREYIQSSANWDYVTF